MGDSSGRTMDDLEEVGKYFEQHGITNLEEFLKEKLERWKDVEIKFGITGDSGVGKSTFINAIRGLKVDDEGAAVTGVKETTRKATAYSHPKNDKIKFWDLPGIGTPNYPDLDTYSKKVGLERYDTFLILTAGRFTQNDLQLAKRVKEMKKSFFFVRTKIDQDVDNEKEKRAFNEGATLNDIRGDCLKNLKRSSFGDIAIFLVSNRKTAKWDFARLQEAILDVLPLRQKQSLTLSLTSHSKNILQEKVKILRDRIWTVAAASAVVAVVPLPGFSFAVDVLLLTKEVNLYKSQLGLPEENSYEFRRMTPENQDKVRKFCMTSAIQTTSLVAAYTASSAVEETARYIPFVGSLIAGSISFSSTYYFLHDCLNELEETAMAFLDIKSTRVVDDYVNKVD